MLILLPPSEAKRPPSSGHVFDISALSFSDLSDSREAILGRLERVSADADALKHLKLSANQRQEAFANTLIRTADAARAQHVYTGVLYNAGQIASLDPAQLSGQAWVFSALWGVTGLFDSITNYRLSITASLPDIKSLARWWRPHLTAALHQQAEGRLVVDCRSTGYQTMWQPPSESPTVTIRVVRVSDGKRSVVSHHAKYLRGVLAGALLREPTKPVTPEELAHRAATIAMSHGPVPTGEIVTDVELTGTAARYELTFVTAAP